MVISSATGVSTPVTVAEVPKTDAAVVRVVQEKKSGKDIENILSTEEYVKQYFADIPIMVQIAKCESRFRHLDPDGEIHRGVVNNADVGVMQINEYYHLDTSVKKNYNIYTIEGNTAYARDLYEREGTRPWNSSKPCWGKYLPSQNVESKELAINK